MFFIFFLNHLSFLISIGTLWEKFRDKNPLPVKKKSHSLQVETSLHAHSADGLGR
jgi:hypothetical protein